MKDIEAEKAEIRDKELEEEAREWFANRHECSLYEQELTIKDAIEFAREHSRPADDLPSCSVCGDIMYPAFGCERCGYETSPSGDVPHSRPTPVSESLRPNAPHHYMSTACLHGEHDKCRVTCKYCRTICQCAMCSHERPSREDDACALAGHDFQPCGYDEQQCDANCRYTFHVCARCGKTRATAQQSIHIFEVTDEEYFAAATAEEAVNCAILSWGQSTYDESSEEFGSPMELDDNALDTMPFNDNGERTTFRAKLDHMIASGEKFPNYFATGNL